VDDKNSDAVTNAGVNPHHVLDQGEGGLGGGDGLTRKPRFLDWWLRTPTDVRGVHGGFGAALGDVGSFLT
jgi:hypothetical protein